MYKNIALLALLALLLPFSGYALTKQERIEEIKQEVRQVTARMQYEVDLIKNNAWIIYLNGASILKRLDALDAELIALTNEYNQIQLELYQEKTCTKN